MRECAPTSGHFLGREVSASFRSCADLDVRGSLRQADEDAPLLAGQVSLHESAITRSTRTTGTIGLIALLLMTAYFYYGYVMIGGLLEPHMLVPYATGMLEQNSAKRPLA